MILKELLKVEALYDPSETEYYLPMDFFVSEIAVLVSNTDYGPS